MSTTARRLARPKRVEARPAVRQPVESVQWVHRERLQSNSYNPNHVAPPELRLLKLSILEDGWTQPIVVRPLTDDKAGPLEIVDGFHRWTVAGDPDVERMTNGLVPVVILQPTDIAHQRMSTIRHNRARGTHNVLRMAEIVNDMLEEGVSKEDVMRRLEMEDEEVERLADRGDKLKRSARDTFNNGWVPGAKRTNEARK